MTRIESISVDTIRLPPASPWEDATNRVNALEFVITTVNCDNGIVGTGFTYSVDVGGTAIAALIKDYLVPLVIGQSALNPERLWQLMERQTRRLGLGLNRLAIAAIDIAIWDIVGKTTDQPLQQLLGGARDSIPAYISEINLSADDSLTAFAERLITYRDSGYRAIKIKVGHDDVDFDQERIELARRLVGPSVSLMFDLNQKWTMLNARPRISKLAEVNPLWVEEPLAWHDIRGHSELRQSTAVPIALGESLFCKEQFRDFLIAEAVDIVQADVAFVGGITEWLKIAHLAESFGKPIAPHYLMELSLPLLCGVQNGLMLENVVGGSFAELQIGHAPITIRDGIAIPSQLPGHGVTFDYDSLTRNSVNVDQLRVSFLGGSK